MPLLENALNIDDGPDPGTKQWELRHALGGGSISKSGSAVYVDDKKGDTGENESSSNESTRDVFSSYFLGGVNTNGNNKDSSDIDDEAEGPLPEDAFHSQDVLSRHLLQQQEEERKARSSSGNAKNIHSRDGADIEYINVDDFRPTKNESSAEECRSSSTLKMAQSVMKDNLQNRGTIAMGSGSDLVLGLV